MREAISVALFCSMPLFFFFLEVFDFIACIVYSVKYLGELGGGNLLKN